MKNQDLSFRKKAGLILCMGMILHFSLFAQCVNNMASKTYDTVLTGIGYGDYQVAFPKWSPDSGLLAAVRINARVSVQYAFTLKDVDVIPSTYTLWIGREDQISSPAMFSDYDNITEQKIGAFPLNPGGTISKGPFTFLDNYSNTDSITATAPFLGSDSVRFDYSPITYSTIHTNNNSSYSYSSTARDTVHFSITYLYCLGAGILATDLTRFEAVLRDPGSVQLSWSVVNEAAGRQYQVQRSRDGQHFTTVGSLPATGFSAGNGGAADYAYPDNLPAGSSGAWYYRLQITDPAGDTYSVIKEVTVGATSGGNVSVYPNPADNFVDLAFDPGAGSGAGWLIELLAADGSRIQSGNYLSSNTIRLMFHQKLAAGVYFVKITDLQGQKSFIKRIIKR